MFPAQIKHSLQISLQNWTFLQCNVCIDTRSFHIPLQLRNARISLFLDHFKRSFHVLYVVVNALKRTLVYFSITQWKMLFESN